MLQYQEQLRIPSRALIIRISVKNRFWTSGLLALSLTSCDAGVTGPDDRRVGPEGGVVSLESGAITLSVPPGALSEEVWFTAMPAVAVPGSEWLVAGSAYEIGPPGTVLNAPVTLTISYAPEALPEGIGAEGLGVFQVVGGVWELKPNPTVNSIARTVSGQVASLSQFGVLAIPVSEVEVKPEVVDLEPGASVQLSAAPRASNGVVLVSRPVTWSTSDQTVATVSSGGLVTAIGEGTATITAASGEQAGTASVTVTVPVSSVLVTPASGSLTVGQTLQLGAQAKDASGGSLSGRTVVWSSNDSTVARVDSKGLVTATGIGSAAISAAVSGKTGTASISVYGSLGISTTSLARGVVGTAYSQVLAASGGNGSYVWEVSSGSLPPGLTLASSSGQISGSPSAAGTSNFTVGVESAGQIARKSLSITVDLVPVASVEVLPASANVTIGESLQFSAVAKDAKGTVLQGRAVSWESSDPLVATVSLSGLAAGVGHGTATITAKVDGFPGWAAVTVSDSLEILTEALESGVVGQVYADTILSGGGHGAHSWSITSGSLPAGLALDGESGILTGTPTAVGAGTFLVQVASTDGQIDTRALSIVVYAPVSIVTASLADGVVGTIYSQLLIATGGDGTYRWSVNDGALPDGLDLNGDTGLIGGTPTTAGSWDFSIQGQSGDGQTATVDLSITVG